MRVSKGLTTAAFLCIVFATAACTQQTTDETQRRGAAALDATHAGADQAVDATKKAGEAAADVTKNAVEHAAGEAKDTTGEVARKSEDLASAAGEAIADSWITTKVKAKFADEIVLRGSDIAVVTTDQVVTLRGTVPSAAASARAAEIARGTERVARVVNRLVVKRM